MVDTIEIYGKTDAGRKRPVNEDSLLITKLDELHILAIADGLGGHAAGEVTSRVALTEIEKHLKLQIPDDDPKNAMRVAITKANQKIYRLAEENPSCKGMGTTLVLAILSQHKAQIANIGDSRAYVIADNIRQITKDHSLVQELLDRNVISREEAFDYPRKNIVTRILGAKHEVIPDFYEEDISGKSLLLCSDGLTDMLRDKEIFETIAMSNDSEKACELLISLANKKGGKDNISVISAKGFD